MFWGKGEWAKYKEWLTRQAFVDHDLSPTAKNAFVVVLWHINQDTLGWALKVGTIATALGKSIRHARRMITELEARSYVTRSPRSGHSNFYQVPPSSVLAWRATSDARFGAKGASQVEYLGISGNGGRICPPRGGGRADKSVRGGRTNLSGVRVTKPIKLTGEVELSLNRMAARVNGGGPMTDDGGGA